MSNKKNISPKTILLPVYNGFVGRNFFRSDVYRHLVADPRITLVAVIPPSKLEFYSKEFDSPRLTFETLDGIGESKFGQVLASTAFNLLRTRTIWFRQRDHYTKYGNYPNFLFKRAINFFLGPFLFPRRIIRWLDRFVPSHEGVDALLDNHKPDLVLVPDVCFGIDRIFLRSAKRKQIYTVGMVRSWDNLTSKGTIQLLPDKLLLHTARMKGQALKYVGMPVKDIIVTGPPGYDDFFRARRATREQFLRSIGVDPSKRLILFAPFYDRYTGSAVIMINGLVDAIKKGRLPSDIHIFIRYRPATPGDVDEKIPPSPYVSVSKPTELFFPIESPIMLSRKDWEFSAEDLELQLNSLAYCDVMINTFSTLTVDASALDKPSIGVRFDADANCPAIHRVAGLIDRHDHYRELEATGGVMLVHSMDELIEGINTYLKNPALHREGRQRMVAEQIQFTDGKSGERAVEVIKGVLFHE